MGKKRGNKQMQAFHLGSDEQQALMKDVMAAIAGYSSIEGDTFTFTRKFGKKKAEGDARPVIHFTEDAYGKMRKLVQHFNSEIAWHGLAKRGDGDDKWKFTVYDILVYPQVVSGVTVSTDQFKYQDWCDTLTDEQFYDLHMQGHSHVTFSPKPSTTDFQNQERLLNNLRKDNWYIFFIWNKRDEFTVRLYDKKENIMFDEADIDVEYESSLEDWINDAKEKLTEHTVATNTAPASNTAATPAANTTQTSNYNAGQHSGAYGYGGKSSSSGWWDGYGVYHPYNQYDNDNDVPDGATYITDYGYVYQGQWHNRKGV